MSCSSCVRFAAYEVSVDSAEQKPSVFAAVLLPGNCLILLNTKEYKNEKSKNKDNKNNNNNTHKKVVRMALVKYTTFCYSLTVYIKVLKFPTQ
jgi:hypothetical protein